MIAKEIYQPLKVEFKPSENKKSALTIRSFIELLKAEEDYYPGDQNNTGLMITRLRKIFYDRYGWNKELIRGATEVEDRYDERLVSGTGDKGPYKVRTFFCSCLFFLPFSYTVLNRRREVLVRKDDKINHQAGTIPEIYQNENQEVILEDGLYCDIGHTLCALDAANYPAVVTPLPDFLKWAYKLLPYIEKNTDAVTWLGDISSSAGEFLFATAKNKKHLEQEAQQKIIDIYAPGQDMLGAIDAYVIAETFDLKALQGLRVTDIFSDYYLDKALPNQEALGQKYRYRRIQIFCEAIGLKNWDGENFSNEKAWLKYYSKQLRNATIFYQLNRSQG